MLLFQNLLNFVTSLLLYEFADKFMFWLECLLKVENWAAILLISSKFWLEQNFDGQRQKNHNKHSVPSKVTYKDFENSSWVKFYWFQVRTSIFGLNGCLRVSN